LAAFSAFGDDGAAGSMREVAKTRKVGMMRSNARGIAVYHEHPEWFTPLFRALDRRGVPYEAVQPGDEVLDLEVGSTWPYEVVFNRMSPSAHLRGGEQAIRHTPEYLRHLEERGVRVINGLEAFQYEVSKVRQLALLRRLGVPHPRTRVVHDPIRLRQATEGLRFPVVVKPNVGGSGAGISRFDDTSELLRAVSQDRIEPSLDGTLLIQEYHRPEGGRITRVEVLDGRFLYAIRVDASGDDFNLCPADLCQTGAGEVGGLSACPTTAPAQGYEPPDDIRRTVLQIVRAAGMEIGGVEYLESERDGRIYFYDVNALSNFVADAPRVVGFDPFERLVDYLEAELRAVRSRVRVGAA
jgi:glutathione synthase/RimK-type ligase-like ATP-grasp enzyme